MMTRSHRFFLPLAATLAVCALPTLAEEVKYFGNGWPIALADAACGDDEWCLTELANCPPGTDGVCTAQAAICMDSRSDPEFPCVVRMDDAAVVLHYAEFNMVRWEDPPRSAVATLRGKYEPKGPMCMPHPDGFSTCFTLLQDPAVLAKWAGDAPSDK